jgi:acyl-CoA synthetase (AMP-forming)/AMP-acid ligase II
MISEPDSVDAAVRSAARRWPDRPFLNVLPETADVYGIPAGAITYGDAVAEVDRLAAAYAAADYGGARVLLLLENRPAFFLYLLALNRIGAVAVPVNPDLRAAELAYLAAHAEPALAVAIPSRIADLEAAAREAGAAFPVVPPDAAPPPARAPVDPVVPAADTPAAMLYTSGTTGRPKGCILSNRYFLHAGRWYAAAGGLCALSTDGERMLTPLPIFHMNAMVCSFMAMVEVGGALTVLDRFHPRTWWDSVRGSEATAVHYLGVMPTLLMKAPPSPADRDHAVRFGFGAGVDPNIHAAFEERFGFPLVEAWAMTETGLGAVLCANRTPRKVGASCLGRPEGGVEARVVAEDGRDAAPGEPGELLVRHAGPDPRHGFFTAYFRDPEATAGAWEGGWFHTGDIVRRDADGDFTFVDRKKNVIRRSGENIAAVEVEGLLLEHPEVRAAAVTAVPDTVRGDEVFACLVVDGERTAARARALVEWALGRMAYYKAPGWVAFVDALPLTATQKISRGELKSLAVRLVEHGAFDTRDLKKRQAA